MSTALAFKKLISAAHPRGTQGKANNYFVTCDCDQDGKHLVVNLEIFRNGAQLDYLMVTPAKANKHSTPELMTSPTDEWSKVSCQNSVISEAYLAAYELVKPRLELGFEYSPVKCVHAEMRKRDLTTEGNHLALEKEENQKTIQLLATEIVKLEQQLVEKLAFKKTALESGGATTSVDKDIVQLQADLSTAQARQTQKQETVVKLDEGAKVLKLEAEELLKQEASGRASKDARTYALIVLRIMKTDPTTGVGRPINKLSLVYRRPGTGAKEWKLIFLDDLGF